MGLDRWQLDRLSWTDVDLGAAPRPVIIMAGETTQNHCRTEEDLSYLPSLSVCVFVCTHFRISQPLH